MRFYTKQHKFYCGIDLHARTMYLCILNQEGKIVLHRDIKTDPDIFLKTITPFREDIVVAVECIFTWYWLADLCSKEDIPFVLGHALYMKAIHGGKAKNDKIDAYKIAALLRGGMMPMAYVYPSDMRSTRDLLRRRTHLARKRAELIAHIQNTNHQYNFADMGRIARKCDRIKIGIADRFTDPSVQDFVSYCRLVKSAKESAGKIIGSSGKKIGNAHLKWAFSEAAVLFLRRNPDAIKYREKLARKHGKAKSLTILAHKLARAVYNILKRKEVFQAEVFFAK